MCRVWVLVSLMMGCATSHPPPVAVEPARPAESAKTEPVRATEPARPCAHEHAELDALPEKALATIGAEDRVVLTRTPCFGTCPAYAVALFGDGRVIARGELAVAQRGEQRWSIAPELARRVLSEFVRVDAFTRKPGHPAVTDLPSANLEVRIGTRQAEIRHYGGGAEMQSWFSRPGQSSGKTPYAGTDNEVLTKLERLVDQATETESRVVGCAADR